MTVRITEHGVKFDSTSRIVGRYSAAGLAAFILGDMWGVVKEDGTGLLFVRPVSDLTEAERHELADYQIGAWNRFKKAFA